MDRIARELRAAIAGVLCERLRDADELALAMYRADAHARQLAAEVTDVGRPRRVAELSR